MHHSFFNDVSKPEVTFDFQLDTEVFLNMAAEEDLRVNAMFLGRWVDTHWHCCMCVYV